MRKSKQCKHGEFTYYTNDKWIGGALDRTGEYSEQEVQKLLQLIPDDGTIIEVGANIGAITVPLVKKAAWTVAFEPEPIAFELLSLNINSNGLGAKTMLVQSAVGDKEVDSAVTIVDYTRGEVNAGAASIVDKREDDESQAHVPMFRLDDHCRGWERLDLLKIDVEGSELAVIQGAANTICRLRPRLYVENDRQEKSVELIRVIMDLGYVLFWHFPKLFNPDPMVGDAKNFVSANMVCFPKEQPYDVSLVADLVRVMSPHDDWHLAVQRRNEALEKLSPRKIISVKSNEWACVVRLGGVGDNVIASSVFAALKKKYGKLEVICAEPQNVVFENNPHIDKLTVKKQGDPPWEDGLKWQQYWLGRSNEYTFFANLSHTCEVHRALTRAQTAYYWSDSQRRKMCGQNYLEAVADVCGIDYADLDPRFYSTDTEVEAALETKRLIGGRYVGWVLTGSRLDKIWPPAAMVIGRIIKELGMPVVMFGAPGKDFEIAKVIEQYILQANGSLKDLHTACSVDPEHPNWPVRRILTQLMQSDVVVSPDTGPAWAMAKEDMPKIIMLSHASPENITKHWTNTISLHADPAKVPCWPCHLLIEEQSDCERHSGRRGEVGSACISSIQPDEVFENVKRSLSKNNLPLLKAAE